MEIYYRCKKSDLVRFPSYTEKFIWNFAEKFFFVDTVTGNPPLQETEFRILYSDMALHILFVCRDNYRISEYTLRDQPLYKQDVVEFFVSDGDISRYREFEQSPHNVLFDAEIIYHDPGHIEINTEWNADKWETTVFHDEKNEILYYEWQLPFASAGFSAPKKGDIWRFNAYRIDRGEEGADEFSALSPTGKLEFHVPERFAFLCFE